MSHRWLIAVSMSAHLAAATGLFAAGVWRIDRLEHPRTTYDLHQPVHLPAPSGGPVAAHLPEFTPRHPHVTHERVQPTTQPATPPTPDTGTGNQPDTGAGTGSGDPDATGHCTENCADGPPAAAVCGDGSLDAGEQCDDGNNVSGDGCSATCRTEVRPTPVATVAPNALQCLRVAGETQVHPSASTQSMMIRDGATKVVGTVKLCISTDGSVTSTRMLMPTRYDEYDAALLSAVRGWRYRPYTLNGAPVAACSTVSFVYRIQ